MLDVTVPAFSISGMTTGTFRDVAEADEDDEVFVDIDGDDDQELTGSTYISWGPSSMNQPDSSSVSVAEDHRDVIQSSADRGAFYSLTMFTKTAIPDGVGYFDAACRPSSSVSSSVPSARFRRRSSSTSSSRKSTTSPASSQSDCSCSLPGLNVVEVSGTKCVSSAGGRFDFQFRRLPDVVQLPDAPVGGGEMEGRVEMHPGAGAALRRTSNSFLIREILRPDFGIRRSSATACRHLLPVAVGNQPSGLWQPFTSQQPTPVVDNNFSSMQNINLSKIVSKPEISYDRKSKADDEKTRNRKKVAKTRKSRDAAVECITHVTSRNPELIVDDRIVRNGAASVEATTNTSGSRLSVPTSGSTLNKPVEASLSKAIQMPAASTAATSTTSTSGLQLPAWVFCTRYSDRPSAGPRSRKRNRSSREKLSSSSTSHQPTSKSIVNPPPSSSSGSSSCSSVIPGDDKRPRTAFNNDQLERLRREFDCNHYLTEERRHRLATELSLHESQIKIWFQNKRAKLKKAAGVPNPLALELMAQGLYNHATVSKKTAMTSSVE